MGGRGDVEEHQWELLRPRRGPVTEAVILDTVDREGPVSGGVTFDVKWGAS